jgi:hypothetical protein
LDASFRAERVLVYATSRWHYVFAGTGDGTRWRVLKIARESLPDGALDAHEDASTMDDAQRLRVVAAIAAGNAASGGARLVARGCALLGVLRLLGGHHLVVVTRRRRLGRLCGRDVFGVAAAEFVRVADPPGGARPTAEGDERRLWRLLTRVDLSRGFFFSHAYRLVATTQANCVGGARGRRTRLRTRLRRFRRHVRVERAPLAPPPPRPRPGRAPQVVGSAGARPLRVAAALSVWSRVRRRPRRAAVAPLRRDAV